MPRPAPSKSETGAADAEALEDGRRLFAQVCEFVTGAAAVDHIPETGLPEVAFAGRSNVGKSTLLNALTGRATLARTSNAPGRTREINFFKLGGRLILADLPGYGYAHAPRVRVKRWTWLIDAYLQGRAGLRRACLLIDARHGIKFADRDMMEWDLGPARGVIVEYENNAFGRLRSRFGDGAVNRYRLFRGFRKRR